MAQPVGAIRSPPGRINHMQHRQAIDGDAGGIKQLVGNCIFRCVLRHAPRPLDVALSSRSSKSIIMRLPGWARGHWRGGLQPPRGLVLDIVD